jgi:hypothetical protein
MTGIKIIHDVFPTAIIVTAPDVVPADEVQNLLITDSKKYRDSRRVEPVRLILTNDMILIGADSSSGPVLIFREQYDPATLTIDKSGTSRVVTLTGKALAFKKDTGCGCGSKLRTWNPYKTLNSVNDPTE